MQGGHFEILACQLCWRWLLSSIHWVICIIQESFVSLLKPCCVGNKGMFVILKVRMRSPLIVEKDNVRVCCVWGLHCSYHSKLNNKFLILFSQILC